MLLLIIYPDMLVLIMVCISIYCEFVSASTSGRVSYLFPPDSSKLVEFLPLSKKILD